MEEKRLNGPIHSEPIERLKENRAKQRKALSKIRTEYHENRMNEQKIAEEVEDETSFFYDLLVFLSFVGCFVLWMIIVYLVGVINDPTTKFIP